MRQALGRGLDALLPSAQAKEGEPNAPTAIPIDRIQANPLQPRSRFDESSLAELARSIKDHGVVQPVVVTRARDGQYELVAGERRLRASRLAGLEKIPAVVVAELSSRDRLALAIVENVQREDLNPIEEARAYRRLIDEFQLNQTQLGEIVGKSRPAISNSLRLLDLSGEVQAAILGGQLSEGHGRALLMVEDSAARAELCQRAVRLNLSVRDLEEAARRGRSRPDRSKAKGSIPIEVRELESELQRYFGTRVRVRCSRTGKGSVTIEFYSLEDLERLIRVVKK